jgi:CBS domain-containing protein
MQVSECKLLKQETASPEEDIFQVSKKMGLNKSIVIVENKKPVGIITVRDIVARVLAKGKDPKKTVAKEVMTKPVFCARDDEDVSKLAKIMLEKDYLTVPVVDKKGFYKGILTIRQIILISKRKHFLKQKQ